MPKAQGPRTKGVSYTLRQVVIIREEDSRKYQDWYQACQEVGPGEGIVTQSTSCLDMVTFPSHLVMSVTPVVLNIVSLNLIVTLFTSSSYLAQSHRNRV